MLKIVVLQEGCPIHAGKLGALIRVNQVLGLGFPSPCRHEQYLQRDIGDLPALQGPASDAGENRSIATARQAKPSRVLM